MATFDLSAVEEHFSFRFRVLRSFYGLTTRDMGDLLNYKSSSAIPSLEKVPLTNRPSMQALINLQQHFGISLDWLFGLSSIPFTEETLQQAEEALADRLHSLFLDFTRNKFSVEQKLQALLRDLLSCDSFSCFTLNDRFVLLFLLTFLDEELCKAKKETRYHNFIVLDNQKIMMSKYPSFIPTLELFHQEMGNPHSTSMLDTYWDFNAFYLKAKKEW